MYFLCLGFDLGIKIGWVIASAFSKNIYRAAGEFLEFWKSLIFTEIICRLKTWADIIPHQPVCLAKQSKS